MLHAPSCAVSNRTDLLWDPSPHRAGDLHFNGVAESVSFIPMHPVPIASSLYLISDSIDVVNVFLGHCPSPKSMYRIEEFT